MKIIECRYTEYDLGSRNGVAKNFWGTAITTKDCEMDTAYRGRGIPTMTEFVPAGTKIRFRIEKGGNAEEPLTWLTAVADMPNDKWGRVELEKHVTYREAFEAVAAKMHLEHLMK